MESFLEHKPSKFGVETLENGVYYSPDTWASPLYRIPAYETGG